jgi:hypothetical protein
MLSVDDFYRIKLVCDHVRCFFDKSSLSFAECFAEFVRADIILALLLLRRKSGLSAAAALNPSRHLSEKEKEISCRKRRKELSFFIFHQEDHLIKLRGRPLQLQIYFEQLFHYFLRFQPVFFDFWEPVLNKHAWGQVF